MMDEDTSLTESPKEEKKGRKRSPKQILKYPIPFRKSSFENHLVVLKALNIGSNKGNNFVSYADIAPFAQLHEVSVSGVLSFFNQIGLTEESERGKYKPISEVVDYFNILEWDQPEAEIAFGKILLNTWFGKHAIQIFQMTPEISKDDLVRSIGKCAQADQSNQSQINNLIKFLEYGKIIGVNENTNNYHLLINPKESINSENPSLDVKSPEKEKRSLEENAQKESLEKKIDSPRNESSNPIHKNDFLPSTINKGQSFISGEININLNVTIDENSDIDKISENILKLKEKINNP
ncbi:hypothetical protein [Methanolacinia paynteri]|uniref:hypothetical protein n=1 Tax=Methanolacinia paynteri TaxID=230356 RepID=UPI001B803CB2|nr:hypothetical protein [Methanolacinia paynteri]